MEKTSSGAAKTVVSMNVKTDSVEGVLANRLRPIPHSASSFQPSAPKQEARHKTFEFRANLCANGETLDLAGKRVSKTRVINQSAINSFLWTRMTLASGTGNPNHKLGEFCR